MSAWAMAHPWMTFFLLMTLIVGICNAIGFWAQKEKK